MKSAESKKPLSGAVLFVSWHEDSSDAWLADENGLIEVNLPENKTLLFAEISFVGFKSIRWSDLKLLYLKDSIFYLNIDTSTLPAVLVKSRRRHIFRAQGDTLSYNVAEMTLPGDRTIEAVLKRIPGVTVRANGTILYNEQPIAGLTIEDDDIMGSRYALGSRSIKPENVDSIQVLENNQRIRALSGLIPSQATYINLKLKSSSKSSAFGNAEVGVGISNKYEASGSLILLNKSLKSVSGSSINNSRPTAIEYLLEKESFEENGSKLKHNLAKPLLNIGTGNNPEVSSDWWQQNKSAGLVTQQYLKLNKYAYHRIGISGIVHNTQQAQSNKSLFRLPADTFTYKEDVLQTYSNKHLSTDYLVELNKPHFFLSISSTLQKIENRNRGYLIDDVNEFEQIITQPIYQIEGNIKSTIPTGISGLLNLNAGVVQQQINENGLLYIGNKIIPPHTLFPDDSIISQKAMQKPLIMSADASWQYFGWVNVGPSLSIRQHSLNWSQFSAGLHSDTSFGSSAVQHWLDATIGLVLSKYWQPDGSVSLKADLHDHSINIAMIDSNVNTGYRKKYILFSLWAEQIIGKEGRLTLNGRYRPGLTSESPIFQAPILENYRQLRFDSSLLSFQDNHLWKLQYDFRKSLKLLFGSVSLSYASKLVDGANQSFISKRLIVVGISPAKLAAAQWRLSTRLSKFWFVLKMRSEVNWTFHHLLEQRLQNGLLNSWYGYNQSCRLLLEKSVQEKFTLQLSGLTEWGVLGRIVSNNRISTGTYYNFSFTSSIAYSFKNWNLNADVESGNAKQNQEKTVNYSLVNGEAAYQFTKQKWSVYTRMLNITNTKKLVKAYNSPDVQQVMITDIRPIQIIIGCRFAF